MAALLELEGIDAFYGDTQVLHGVGFAVQEGSITTLLGANGAGKTTCLRAICAMVRTSGEIRFAGRRINGRATEHIARLGLAHVPEGRGTFVGLTVDENLRLAGHLRRGRAALRDDIDRVFGYFPRLKERRGQTAGTLSGGEQQMLAISRALTQRPRLMLLDEPSFGLAPMAVQEIFRIMRRIARDEGISILLVEQNASLALDLADHACLLESGKLVMSGPAGDLRGDDTVRRVYLGQ